jgi:hypothetical protein
MLCPNKLLSRHLLQMETMLVTGAGDRAGAKDTSLGQAHCQMAQVCLLGKQAQGACWVGEGLTVVRA